MSRFSRPLVLGSRGSALALRQSEQIAARLGAMTPGREVRIEVIRTTGDAVLDAPLAQIGGKGAFTKEIEDALLDGRIDLAVHSLKDLPTTLPDGLCLAAIPRRETPYDALICARWPSLEAIPPGSAIGTSSLRRTAFLAANRPDLRVVDLRGNIDTRLGKVARGDVDGAILACAGLERLGRAEAVTERLAPEVMLSAPAQGALGIEARADDAELLEEVAMLTCSTSAAEARAERACLAELEGGCQLPLGALARAREDGALHVQACLCHPNGSGMLRHALEGSMGEPEALGQTLAAGLIEQGARELLASIR